MTIRVGAVVLFCGLASLTLPVRAAAPSCSLVPGWTAQGAARSYAQDNLFEYMDGNAEGYLLYGFQIMQGVTCQQGGTTLVIDISDFGDADSAYGMFSANRDPGQPTVKLGMGGQIVPRRAIFVKGKYYAEIAANPEGDYTTILKQWTAAIDKTLEGSTEPPAALAWFPTEKLQSLRLVPESVLGVRLLKRGYVGQYDAGKAFVVAEESPATASALMDKLRARFTGSTPAKIADDAFVATDQYLGRLYIFRKGRYVAGYGNLAEGQDGVALAAALAKRIP
jgi:hypothetical protein